MNAVNGTEWLEENWNNQEQFVLLIIRDHQRYVKP